MSPYRRTAAEVDADLMAAHDARVARETVQVGLIAAAIDELRAPIDHGHDGYLLTPRGADLLAALLASIENSADRRRSTWSLAARLAETVVIDDTEVDR